MGRRGGIPAARGKLSEPATKRRAGGSREQKLVPCARSGERLHQRAVPKARERHRTAGTDLDDADKIFYCATLIKNLGFYQGNVAGKMRGFEFRGLMFSKESRETQGAHELAPARVSAQVPIVTFSHDGLRHAPPEN